MNSLILADIHLDNNPLNENRFKIFDVIVNLIQSYDIDEFILLGDLTEIKDRHQASFVFKIFTEFKNIIKNCPKLKYINILCGNHDYIDPLFPFYSILENLSTPCCKITFIKTTKVLNNNVYIPFNEDPIQALDNILVNVKDYKNIFLHHTFKGARISSNYTMGTLDPALLQKHVTKDRIYSGHIHLAQDYYIGSPYAIDFGDNNKGRALLILQDRYSYIDLPIILNKITLDITDVKEINDVTIFKGDQVRVILNLDATTVLKYAETINEIKQLILQKGAILNKLEVNVIKTVGETVLDTTKPDKINEILAEKDIIKNFCRARKLPNDYYTEAIEMIEKC